MNTFLGSLIFLFFITLILKEVQGGQKMSKFVKAYSDCKEITGISNEELKLLHQKKVPETKPGKCFLACMNEKAHMMKDGKYDFEYAIKIAEETLKNHPKELKKSKAKILKCAEEVKEVDDPCEIAAKLGLCMSSQMK